jgi:hypothetical protein
MESSRFLRPPRQARSAIYVSVAITASRKALDALEAGTCQPEDFQALEKELAT